MKEPTTDAVAWMKHKVTVSNEKMQLKATV